jgi:hypothetical protein
MVPPAERFKNTTNRMIANKDKKIGIAPPTTSGQTPTLKPTGNATVSSAGNKRSSAAQFIK